MRSLISRAVSGAAAALRATEWGTESQIPPPGAAGPAASTPGAGSWALGISTVLACVDALSGDFRTLPFWALQGDPNGARQRVKNQPQIVLEPFGPDLAVADGMGQIIVSLAMRGNAFLYVADRDALGLPTLLLVLHPDKVKPRRLKNGAKVFVIGTETFMPGEIIHLTGLMMPGDVAGVDVLTAQRLLWDMAMKVNQYADGFFGGGGSPAGVISVPGSGNRKKAREVKDAWEAGNSGVANAHRPAVLFGNAKWTAMTVTPENAQFLATRQFLREEVCGIYGVPLQRIQAIVENASQGGGKGLDSIDAGYVKHTLLKYAIGIERVWNAMIPGGQGSFAQFDFNVFLRADAKERAEIAQIHRVIGARIRDEIRADEGWPALPGGKGQDPDSPLNSNASPTGGTDNAPKPGGQGGTT